MSYVYKRTEPTLFTVGFYDPNGGWHPDSDYADREEAAARVAWLNGSGRDEPPIEPATDYGDADVERWLFVEANPWRAMDAIVKSVDVNAPASWAEQARAAIDNARRDHRECAFYKATVAKHQAT